MDDTSEPVDQVAESAPKDDLAKAGIDARATSEPKRAITSLGLAALGIVFGDIGTSPLYTLKTVLADAGHTDRAVTLGVLSLILWTLVVVCAIKYVSFAMRIDNDGEGGILALMSLIGIKKGHRPAIVAAGLFGAALIYGDGAITPAISVLSALEGLHLAVPSVDPYILPLAVAILVGLFLLQPFGTARIGTLFGPVMLAWFAVLALLGLWGIAQNPGVLAGLSPTYAYTYLVHGGFTAFALLGGVFLCVTGAEALYADMGHFGRRPIWLAWFAVAFPALILNYAGQAAVVLAGTPVTDNIFFVLCPSILRIPLILLATAATIIASQSIITGAFSMSRQAIQLGWMPRLVIRQTSDEGHGQIYVGGVNWILMIVTVGLALAFEKSDNLSAAYGMAVSATMLLTTILLFLAMRDVWKWPLVPAGLVALAFLVVDLAFFGANLLKIQKGGWVPIVLAIIVFTVMRVWHEGVEKVGNVLRASSEALPAFFARIEAEGVARVPGTAIFLSRSRSATPPLLAWHVRQNRSLYSHVLIVTIATELVPRIPREKRFEVTEELSDVWRVFVRYGFMERIGLDDLLPALQSQGCDVDMDQVVYYVGHETILPGKSGARHMPAWAERMFAVMERNQAHLTDVLSLPNDRVVEIGRHIEL